jgi:3-deoxy-7-phosphoheptulonate synthase
VIHGKHQTVIAALGEERPGLTEVLEPGEGVEKVLPIMAPYKRASSELKRERTAVKARSLEVGGTRVAVIAGPCSVESEEQIVAAARAVRAAGAVALRGGAFKPRTSPYSFQGLGRRGLELLALARRETGLAIVTEAMDEAGANLVAEIADCIQIGARNMQNYSLLKVVGRLGKPVLLKRGLAATITDLLLSAEYILAEGNDQVILCERGVRSFDPSVRNLFDLTAIPVVHKLSHLPIIADPSHGTGLRDQVTPMARAAVAAGADGMLIEVHPSPDRALSDGAQSLYPWQFTALVDELRPIVAAIGRSLAAPPVRSVGIAPVLVG